MFWGGTCVAKPVIRCWTMFGDLQVLSPVLPQHLRFLSTTNYHASSSWAHHKSTHWLFDWCLCRVHREGTDDMHLSCCACGMSSGDVCALKPVGVVDTLDASRRPLWWNLSPRVVNSYGSCTCLSKGSMEQRPHRLEHVLEWCCSFGRKAFRHVRLPMHFPCRGRAVRCCSSNFRTSSCEASKFRMHTKNRRCRTDPTRCLRPGWPGWQGCGCGGSVLYWWCVGRRAIKSRLLGDFIVDQRIWNQASWSLHESEGHGMDSDVSFCVCPGAPYIKFAVSFLNQCLIVLVVVFHFGEHRQLPPTLCLPSNIREKNILQIRCLFRISIFASPRIIHRLWTPKSCSLSWRKVQLCKLPPKKCVRPGSLQFDEPMDATGVHLHQ